MTNFNLRQVAATAAIAIALSSSAEATPVQGNLGSTSTGSVQISATVPASVRLYGLTDFSFGTLDPATAASVSKNVCVWSNTSTKGYSITASGDGGGSGTSFKLSNSSTTLDYGVEWAGSASQSSGTALTAATLSGGFTSTATSPTCASSPTSTASLIVKFSTAQMQAAAGSSTAYTGTLTLVVAPE
jgi:hypothetical protein